MLFETLPDPFEMKNIFFFFFFISFFSFSQTQIQGLVLDIHNGKPLPFATVITNTNFGTLADIDGKFHIKTRTPFNILKISYVGYQTQQISLTKSDKFIRVKLKTSIEKLNEVYVTTKENPAIQIIKNVIANKPKNNIEKALSYFRFKSYNKSLITANLDSLSGAIDSVFAYENGKKTFSKIDSTNYKFKKELEDKHLFISEKISEFQFQQGKKKKELVLASRMAGLKQPIYELFALTIQDFSFYNDFYTVAGTKYTNPIAKNALKYYYYKILDTVSNYESTSILIHYKPKKSKEFIGLEGVLYIDHNSFAITKAIAELKGFINIKATQNYHYFKKYNIWFPSDRNVVIEKGDTKESINLFGGVLSFRDDKKKDTLVSTPKKNPSDAIYFVSKTTNSEIEINKPLLIKSSATTLEFKDDAHKKSQEFWNTHRKDSLTNKGESTYIFLDSIAEEEGIEKKINLARTIFKGYYPTKYFNLNLGKIINFNNYEGFRFGLGGITNNNFSSKYRFEGYGAYGTKDQEFKYRFGGSLRLNKNTNTWLGANYSNDLREAAGMNFINKNASFSLINLRYFNLSKFYNYKTVGAYLHHDIFPNLEAKIQFNTGNYTPLFNYEFHAPTKNVSDYKLTTLTFGFQYNPKNEYMNSPIGKLRVKNQFPQFTFQITRSFESLLKGDFNFTRMGINVLHKINYLKKTTTIVTLEGGIVFGQSPISHLFNTRPNYNFQNPWVKRITFSGINSFETMGYNEFLSDKFVALHLKQEFQLSNTNKKFKPVLNLVTRAALGNINNPEYHQGLTFKALNKGYFESGIEFDYLLKGFGFSGLYRYGFNRNTLWSNNLAIKLSYKFRLDF